MLSILIRLKIIFKQLLSLNDTQRKMKIRQFLRVEQNLFSSVFQLPSFVRIT